MALDPDLTEFTTASPYVVSYSYIDTVNQTGIQTFYGMISRTSTGDDFFLSTQADYGSDEVDTTTNRDYDASPFSTPRTASGTATINFYGRMSGGGITSWGARLSHYDGTTETAISSTITSKNDSGDYHHILKLPLTEKLFKEGDILRLTLTHTGHDASAFYIEASKPIKLNVPFKLDI